MEEIAPSTLYYVCPSTVNMESDKKKVHIKVNIYFYHNFSTNKRAVLIEITQLY